MASVNKVFLLGRVGAEPETRYMPNGDAVCNIRFATSESWKDKATGEKREITEWHRLTIYRRLAEVASQYVTKGMQLYVEGRIRTRKWQDKEGQDRYTTEIEVTEMQMLGSRQGTGAGAGSGNDAGHDNDPAQRHGGGGGNGDAAAQGRRQPAPAFDDLGQDIPFCTCRMHSDPVFMKATTPIRRTV